MSFFRPVSLLAALLLGANPAPAQEPIDLKTGGLQVPAPTEIGVGKNVQVSAANGSQAHFELDASAHPSEPGVLLGAGMRWAGPGEKYNVVVYRSADGGQSWKPALSADRERVLQDPTLAFGRDGQAYFAAFGGPWMRLYRSPDGGRTWEGQDVESFDRPWVSVAPPGGTAPGRVYLHGNGEPEGAGNAIDAAVYRAESNGTRLRPAKGLNLAGKGREMLAPGNSAVLSDGTYVFPYLVRLDDPGDYEAKTLAPPRERRRPNALLRVAVSTDGGGSFTTKTVARWYHRFGRGRTAAGPKLAVDTTEGPFAGRVYVAWTDYRSGEGQVLLSHSDRPTETWSDPLVVNRGGGPAFHPALAVNRRGILGVHWYDRRSSKSKLGWRARFAASRDGGETVSRSTEVAEAPYRYAWDGGLVVNGGSDRNSRHEASAYLQFFNASGGHTAGLTAGAGGTFYPFWVDNRTGTPQMWTAPVEVEGEVIPYGSPALSGLEDITRKTALRTEKAEYNDTTQVTTLTLHLQNVSRDTLSGPMALRLIDLYSEFGEVRLADAGSDRRLHGAVRRVSSPRPDGLLPPGGTTRPFRLHGRIEDPRALGPMPRPPPGREVPGYAVLQVRAQALGNVSDPTRP